MFNYILDRSVPVRKSPLEEAALKMAGVKSAIEGHVFGRGDVIDTMMASIVGNGHILLQGPHGLGKTSLTEGFAMALGVPSNRIQCTSDLMPADILGSDMLNEAPAPGEIVSRLKFEPGPIFAALLHADELNRLAKRTMGAFLQSMAERRVTHRGVHYDLPKPHLLIATQNPFEFDDSVVFLTPPQLDRFGTSVNMTNVSFEDELRILQNIDNPLDIDPVLRGAEDGDDDCELLDIQALAKTVAVCDMVHTYALRLVHAFRDQGAGIPSLANHFVTGAHIMPGPRPSKDLISMGRAVALLEGAPAVKLEHIQKIAANVLYHRANLKDPAMPASTAEGHLREFIHDPRVCQPS